MLRGLQPFHGMDEHSKPERLRSTGFRFFQLSLTPLSGRLDFFQTPGTIPGRSGGTMTDLKPIRSGSKSGAPNLGTTSDLNPAKLQLALQSGAPAKPAQTNGAQTTVPNNKPRPETSKSDCSVAPCTQRGCPGTIADGYCDVCGIPAA